VDKPSLRFGEPTSYRIHYSFGELAQKLKNVVALDASLAKAYNVLGTQLGP